MVLRLDNARFYIATALIAFATQNAAFNEHFSTFGLGLFDGLEIIFNGFGIDERTNMVVLVERITNVQLRICSFEHLANLVVNAFVDN